MTKGRQINWRPFYVDKNMSEEDRAQEIELKYWEQANRSRPAPVKYAPGDAGYGPEFCEIDSCGEPMPDVRREHGFRICVACKRRQELRDKSRR